VDSKRVDFPSEVAGMAERETKTVPISHTIKDTHLTCHSGIVIK
jgi:hypothetical protein